MTIKKVRILEPGLAMSIICLLAAVTNVNIAEKGEYYYSLLVVFKMVTEIHRHIL